MIVGVDFDNTIVCYNGVFHSAAVERGLIPEGAPATKEGVRDALRRCGREDAWTELQGYVYGVKCREAQPFPGVVGFFLRCRREGVPVHVISHRTRRPYRGPAYDLHRAAHEWLASRGFFDPAGAGLSPARIHFETTKEAKSRRIAEVGCTHFVDDLPEFLADPGFPAGVARILFDPEGRRAAPGDVRRAGSWEEIGHLLREFLT